MVSVVIPTKNRAESLAHALLAIRGQDYEHFEVIVVDNGSTDNTPDIITQYEAKCVHNPIFGISRSRQMGIDSACGEIIAVCDDDSVPEPDWISQLVRRLAADDALGLIGGKIIQVGFPEDKGMGKIGQNGIISFVTNPQEAHYFASSNQGIRKAAIDAIGGYDLFFREAYEEVDLIFRLRDKGFHIDYEPLAKVRHVNPGNTFRKGHYFFDLQLMRLYFCMRHYRPHSWVEWSQFLLIEWKMVCKELRETPYKFYDAGRKREFRRWIDLGRRVFNTITARLAIPWLLSQVHQQQKKEAAG